MNIPNPYEWKSYKLLMVVPLFLLIAAAFFAGSVKQGIDLKGGLLISVQTDADFSVSDLKNKVYAVSGSTPEVRVFNNPSGRGVEIELENDEKLQKAEEELKNLHELDELLTKAEIEAAGDQSKVSSVSDLQPRVAESAKKIAGLVGYSLSRLEAHEAASEAEQAFRDAKSGYRDKLVSAVVSVTNPKTSSFKEVGSSLSKFFFGKTQEVVLLAFVLSGIIIFVVFRSFVPSLAIMFGAFADIAITYGAMGLFGIPLTLASIAALLMLIGFSLDTDVLLTVRLLKRKEGTPAQRAFDAMKTAFMMNLTTLGAFGILTLLAYWLQISVYFQIGAVAVIGGVVDFFATWCVNAPLVLWYLENKAKREAV